MQKTETIIIGAGPAGLAVAGRLRRAGKDFIILEGSQQIAHSWQNHYHRLHLHTVKKFSHLPFLSFPDSYPNYVPRQLLVDYYESYAEKFNIKPVFDSLVTSVKKEENCWLTEVKTGEIYQSENVVFCTGFNRVPFRPHFKNEEQFVGEILHSRDYRSAKDYAGQRVLVVGMGNTGAEIALDLCEQGAKPALSVRSEINIVPRDFNGRSIQETKQLLSPLPHFISDGLGTIVQRMTIGNLEKYGIRTPKISPAAQLRKYGKTPVIDLGTVKEIKKGNISVLPDIQQFNKHSLLFKNGMEVEFDAVILATGYRAQIEDFLHQAAQYLNEFRVPEKPVYPEKIYFVGFDAYASGLLNSIFQDSKTVIDAITINKNINETT